MNAKHVFRLGLMILAAACGAAVAHLLLPALALADNCDIQLNPQDCQNTAWAVGSVATAAAAAAAAAAATSKRKRYTKNPKPNKYEYNDCDDAARQLSWEKGVGTTRPYLRYHAMRPQVSVNPDGSYNAVIRLTWRVDPYKTIVTLPEISWPNMTDAERLGVKDLVDAMLAHEEGHVRVAENYARDLSGERLSVTGSSPEAAKAELMKQLAEHERAVATELDKKENDYDDLTEHGANQSIVGGKDTELRCPSV